VNPPEAIIDVCRAIADSGGQAWLVGGAVRDHLMGLDCKDFDIEVHRLEADGLKRVLSKLGSVNEIGKSFGVFKLTIGELDCDVSIPRHDSQVGPSHKDIVIIGDPFMGLESASRRRDLTVNAIAFDPLSGEYQDHFGGIRDIERGRLSAVDPRTFGDDPLRALRVVQFAARFGFSVHPDLAKLCRKISLLALPPERIWGEVEKLLLLAPVPSIGWNLAHELGILAKVMPEIASLSKSDVAAALDRAAARLMGVEGRGRKAALMLSAMLHNADRNQVEATLDRLGVHKLFGFPTRKRVIEVVICAPRLTDAVDDRELRRLSDETEVLLVAEAAYAKSGNRAALNNLSRAEHLGIALGPLPVLLKGSDLSRRGVAPGPQMGEVMRAVREAQIEGEVADRDGAIIWLEDHIL
jgi:tRNA nucleotidyltransferase (CCA-adding enzyme)